MRLLSAKPLKDSGRLLKQGTYVTSLGNRCTSLELDQKVSGRSPYRVSLTSRRTHDNIGPVNDALLLHGRDIPTCQPSAIQPPLSIESTRSVTHEALCFFAAYGGVAVVLVNLTSLASKNSDNFRAYLIRVPSSTTYLIRAAHGFMSRFTTALRGACFTSASLVSGPLVCSFASFHDHILRDRASPKLIRSSERTYGVYISLPTSL